MSLGGDLALFVGGLISQALDMPGAQREAELDRIRRTLRTALERLDGIEPNAPRIHELGEKRRAEIEAAERSRTERGDEPTVETALPARPR